MTTLPSNTNCDNRNEAGYYAYGLPTSDSDVKSYDPYLYGDKMMYTLKGLNIYDSNGNLTADPSRGILQIKYNRLNQPTDVYLTGGQRQHITYDGLGGKLSVEYSQVPEAMLTSPETVYPDSEYKLQSRRSYVGPHVFRDGKLEYSAFAGGYFDPQGGTMYYLTDWQGNNAVVADNRGNVVQEMTYYPYGEPTIEPGGQRYLFGGKEREHAGGRNAYDFGARILTPYGSWSTPDPLAWKFYPLSPYSYCGGDPINFIDPDGKIFWNIMAGIVGATIDAVTQISANIIEGQTFGDALCNVDITSILASGVTSALLGPGAAKSTKIASGIITVADATVDMNLNGNIEYIGGEEDNEKPIAKVFIDIGVGLMSDFGIKHQPMDLSAPEIRSTSDEITSFLEIGSKNWTKKEMDRTTTIVLKFNGEGAKKIKDHLDEKNKEKTDAIKPAKTLLHSYPQLNKSDYEKLY